MPSMRPSQCAMQQRTDGGPFLRIDLSDAVVLTEEELKAVESGDEYESISDEIYGTSRVYYSDVALSDDAPELGTDFIHVHHEVPLHTLGGPQNVDPVNDMKPLCPNCHAMVHRADPPIPVVELREQLVLNG